MEEYKLDESRETMSRLPTQALFVMQVYITDILADRFIAYKNGTQGNIS